MLSQVVFGMSKTHLLLKSCLHQIFIRLIALFGIWKRRREEKIIKNEYARKMKDNFFCVLNTLFSFLLVFPLKSNNGKVFLFSPLFPHVPNKHLLDEKKIGFILSRGLEKYKNRKKRGLLFIYVEPLKKEFTTKKKIIKSGKEG